MKVMLKRTLLLSLLVLVVASLTVFGISAEALTGTYADDAAAVEAGAVAKIAVDGEATTYYATLADAMADATADNVVTLIADITDPGDLVDGGATVKGMSTNTYIVVEKGQTVVLDLNGHTIAVADPMSSGSFAIIVNLGTLTINDSSAEQTGAITVTSTTSTSGNPSVLENRGGTLTINGGTIEHKATDYAFAIYHWANTTGDAYLNINGGTVKSGYVGIYIRAESPTAETNPNGMVYVNMTGGTVTATKHGAYLADMHYAYGDSAAAVTISGNAILEGGDYAYYSYPHKTTVETPNLNTVIEGGTFNGKVRAKDGDITITDGTFNGAVSIRAYDPEQNKTVAASSSDAITSGTFNAGVNPDYLASTADTLLVVCVTGADGSASVYTFETMGAALAALESVDASATVNVSFCKDLDVTDSIVLDRDMIVDGNGYTVSSATAAATITVNANVTFANITVTNSAESGAAIALGATASLHADPTTVLTAAAPFSGYTVGQAITTTDEDLANALNAAGYALTASTANDVTTYTVVTNAPKAALNGWNYDTFANAFADAVAGDVITLLDNLTVDASIVISADITIDANGHTITSNANGAVFALNASLTLVDATIINNVNDAVAFLLNADVDLTVTGNSALTTATILGGYDLVAHTHKVTVGSAALSAALENEGYFMVDNGDGTYTVSEHAAAKIGNTLFHSLQDALDAAQNGDTIIILKNIELDATVEVTMDLTFSGNFTLISSSATPVFTLADGVALTINCDVECTAENGKLLSAVTDQVVKTNNTDVRDLLNAEGYAMVEETTGVWTVKAAKAAIGTLNYASLEAALAAVQEGETIELLADAELTASAIIDKDITINGNFTITSSAPITFVVNKKLTVNCATVNTYDTGVAFSLGNSATVAINGAVTASKVISGYDVALHTVTTTVEAVANKLNGEGYALVKTDNTWTVMTDKPEAAIDGWNYVTVEDAIAAGGVVTLLRDVTVEATIEVAGALTFTGNYTLTSTAATAFKLANGATLALNCKLEAADVLDATGAWAVTTSVKAIAEQLNAEGYSLTESAGVWTITSNNPEVAVDGWNVDTLKNALDKATDGQTVVLLRNISTAEAAMNIVSNITLDGNGKKITSAAPDKGAGLRVVDAEAVIKNLTLETTNNEADAFVVKHNGGTYAKVTLIDSTIVSKHHGVYLYKTIDADVILENVSITSGNGTAGGSAIYTNAAAGNVQVKNGTTLTANGNANSYGVQLYANSTATVTLEGGTTTTSNNGGALYFNGTGASGTIKVTGDAKVIGTFTAYATGDVTAHTLDFSESTRYIALVKTERSGSRFSYDAYEDLANALNTLPEYSDGTITVELTRNVTDFAGATVAFPCTIDGNGHSITVADGKTAFTMGADCTSLALNNVSVNGNILAGFAAGKTVTTNMEAIAISLNAQGYALHKEGDVWTVAGLGVVSLNGWNYATIQEALSVIKAGESLNVLIDFTTDATAVIDKDITVYGNGKKITSTAGVAIQISNIVTINDLTLYASGVGIKTADGPVDPIVITLNDCTIGDSAKPIGSHGIQFQYIGVDVTLNMTNSTVYAVGRGVHSDMSPSRTVNINIKMDTLDTTNPTICSTGNNGLSFHYANDVNVTLKNVYIKAKDTAFGASQHNQNSAANPKIVVASATNCKFESTTGIAVGMNMNKNLEDNRFIADVTLTNCTLIGVTEALTLDGATTELGATKLTMTGGSVSGAKYGLFLRGDVAVTLKDVDISTPDVADNVAIYVVDNTNVDLTLTDCTVYGYNCAFFYENATDASVATNVKINATRTDFESKNSTTIHLRQQNGNEAKLKLDLDFTNCTLTSKKYGMDLTGAAGSTMDITGGTFHADQTTMRVSGYTVVTIKNATLTGGVNGTAYGSNSVLRHHYGTTDVTYNITDSTVSVLGTGGYAIHSSNGKYTLNLTRTTVNAGNTGTVGLLKEGSSAGCLTAITMVDSTITAGGIGMQFKMSLESKEAPHKITIRNTTLDSTNATITSKANEAIKIHNHCNVDLVVENAYLKAATYAIYKTDPSVATIFNVDLTVNNCKLEATSGYPISIADSGNTSYTVITAKITNTTASGYGGYVFDGAEGSTVEITGGSITADLHLIYLNDKIDTLTVSNVTLTANGSDTDKDNKDNRNRAIYIGTATEVTITGGSITATGFAIFVNDDAADITLSGTTVTVDDSTATGNSVSPAAFYFAKGGELTMVGGSIDYNGATGAVLLIDKSATTLTVTLSKDTAGNGTQITSDADGFWLASNNYEKNDSDKYVGGPLALTFTATGANITSKGNVLYRPSTGTDNSTTVVSMTDCEFSSSSSWAIDLMQQDFTDDTCKVDVTLTRCTITGAYGVRVAGYEAGTAANTSGYALQITGGSISTTNDVLAIEGIYALVKDATLTFAGTGSSNRAVYMQSNTSNAPKLVLDNTTLTYKRTDGQAIYLANNGSTTVILQNNAKIDSKCHGIWSGETMYDNTVTLTNSTIDAAGDGLHFGNAMMTTITITLTNSTVEADGNYGIYFNAKNAATGTLKLTLNGATIKTTAADSEAIFMREGMLELTSPENSAANKILAEATGATAIYFDIYYGESTVTLYNTTVKAGRSGIYAVVRDDDGGLTVAQDINVSLINSTVTTSGLHAIYYNSRRNDIGTLSLYLNGATIKTTAAVADDVDVKGLSASILPHAIFVREGMLTITSPENSGKNLISAEGNRGMAIYLDQYCGVTNITLYNTEIKGHSDAFSLGSDLIDSNTNTEKIDTTQFKGKATVKLYNSAVTSTINRGIWLVGSGTADITLTDTTVRAYKAAIEYCTYGTAHSKLTIKMTNKDLTGRTGENADIYSETYRALNFLSGANYTLDLDNVSVWAGTEAVYRTRPDGGNTTNVWFTGDFDNCNFVGNNDNYVLWFGNQNPGTTTDSSYTTWLVDLEFTDCTVTGNYGIVVTSRPNVESSVKMTNVTIDAQKMAMQGAGKIKVELNNVDMDGFLNGSQSTDPVVRFHFGETYVDLDFTNVTIRHNGTGSANKDSAMGCAGMYISNGIYDLKAHNFKVYAEGSKLHAMNLLGKDVCNVEITGDSVFHGSYGGIIFSPACGGTFKMHLNGDARNKTTPDVKAGEHIGFWMRCHANAENADLTDVFTLDFKNVYLEAQGNGVHRSNDSCTVTGTFDQCKFISKTDTALYLTNNSSTAKVHFDDFVISNTIADGVNGFLTSGIAGETSKFTWNNVNIHGSNYGALTSGVVEYVINDSVISAGKKGVQAARGTAAFRASAAGNVLKLTATNTTFEQLGYGTMEVWDNPDTNAAGDPASCCEAGAIAIYVSNGDQYLTFNNCRIYAKEDFGIGLQRGGGARDLDREITLNNSTVEVGFICIGFSENAYAADGKININNSTLTSEKGLVIRCNGTNANTKLTINITDSILTTNGTALKNTDITDKDESKYLIRAIMLVDGSFTINMHGNSEINAPNTNAISMGAGAGALKFNMTGGTITGNEVIEISGGAGGIDFDMTGGRMIAEGTVAIRLRPGAGKNTVDIKMDALNTTTPDIEARAAWAYAFYIHNGANLSMTFENAHVSATEAALNKTDPNNDGTYNVVNFYTLAITATNSKFAVVGHEGDNSGYTVFRIADTAAKQSPIISQITLIDCEIINSANRTDGSMHGFRIDAAEGSFLKIYGGSVSVAHTAFRFRESMDLTVDVSPNTGKGAVIYAGQYVVDPCDNDDLPDGAPVYEHVQSATIIGATIETENRVIHLTDDKNGAVMEFNLVMTDSEITAGGIAFFFNITGRVNAVITNCDVTAKQGFSTNAATLSVITLRDTNMRCTHRTYEMHGVEGSVLNIIGGIHTNTHDESLLELYEHFDANIYGGYFRSENAIVLRGRDFATLNVYGGYFELAPAEGVALSKWKGVVRIGTDAGGAGTITNIYGGTFVAPDDVPCYIFCLNKGRNINLYAFNAKGGADIYANQNAANVALSYPTAEKLYSVNMPVMNDGAQVRLTMGENNEGGIRFVTNLSASIFDYVKYMTDDVNSITFGTLIAPLDYVQKVPAFTADLLDNAGLAYLDIEAKNGLIYNLDGSVTIRAAINQIKEKNYDRAFAAIAYVKYTVNGEEVCLYSAFDAEQNARSLKQLATSALADTMNIQTSTYRFAVGDGTYSRYTDEQRAAMTVYVLCNYREEIVYEPTATTPGLIKGWCDHCGTHFEELLPPVA